MTQESRAGEPTPEEIAAIDARVESLVERIAAVPIGERNPLTSAKFAGPIAETIIDEAGAGNPVSDG